MAHWSGEDGPERAGVVLFGFTDRLLRRLDDGIDGRARRWVARGLIQ